MRTRRGSYRREETLVEFIDSALNIELALIHCDDVVVVWKWLLLIEG
jgi:hypothetical protein